MQHLIIPGRPRRARHIRKIFSWIGKKIDGAEEQTPKAIHIPVLLHETVSHWVNPKLELDRIRYYVDGTTGFGGHSRELLLRNPQAHLLCIDRDPEVGESVH